MNILVVGGGCREHAIIDALISGNATVYCAMPMLNPAIKGMVKDYKIIPMIDSVNISKYAVEKKIDIAIIGPEAPLEAGVVDELEKKGIKCIGPRKELALLETSKGFTRNLLNKLSKDASPKFRTFDNNNYSEILKYLEALGEYVIKPDGLSGGKGVRVYGEHINSNNQALAYCKEILENHSTVIIEEKLDGEEFSLQTLTDGKNFLHFPPVQDHKRAYENDLGPNTGGMGSYSDANHLLPFLTHEDVDNARKITEQTARLLKEEFGAPYKGIMFGGFMKTANGVKILEYNARFGDPEAMNVLPLIRTNFAEICKATVETKLGEIEIHLDKKATVCKYIVPIGYPDKPETGKITIQKTNALTYYGSVEEREDGIYTTSSRAVAFVGIGATIDEAEKIAEKAATLAGGKIFHRSDIGTKELISKRVRHIKKLVGN